MYTSLMLFALAGCTSSMDTKEAPLWQSDYKEARKQAELEKKPVAVFFGSGKEGWNKVARGGSLGNENRQLLSAQYVCVYLDGTSEDGKRVAKALEVSTDAGLVISDRAGQVMAFHHQGDLTNQDLNWYLKRYAEPGRTAAATETELTFTRRSYYPAGNGAVNGYQPAMNGYQRAMGSRSC